jgi:aspartate aminotransferase|tara:strand:+ start:534 stop:1718 length:1185 start_codon:yes stop_codon:yes gene_type:complete
MTISSTIKSQIESGSWIRKMFEEGALLKKKYGEENVFDLSLGNPIMEPPEEFFEQLQYLASNPKPGLNRYMPNAGYLSTRTSIAKQLTKEIGLNFIAEDIVMTCGAGGALNITLKTLLDPGDEVIIFSPFFAEYIFYIQNHNGKYKIVSPDNNFYPDLNMLDKTITKKTKAILINSPNNPSGIIYPPELLEKLSIIINKKEIEFQTDIFVISDEPYKKITFDNVKCPEIFYYFNKSIIATSHSKDLALAGNRIGYIAINPKYKYKSEIIDGITFCNRTLGFVNAPAIMQHIVENLQEITIDVNTYKSKRDFMYKNLTDMGYYITKPQGAFYMFPKSPIKNELEFIEELKKENVLVVPGRGFGIEGYFRISYCLDDKTLKGSLKGFQSAINKFIN